MIISAFPACGKTYAFEKMIGIKGLKVLDSDSSKFSWVEQLIDAGWLNSNLADVKYPINVRNPKFPSNYIQHIKDNMESYHYIFVSSHKAVRDAMNDNNIPYVLIYPDRSLLDTWVARCYVRGNDEKFVNTLIENWDRWITECEEESGCSEKIKLQYNQYLLDVIAERSR